MKQNTESWQRATVRGALVWGSVYSTATAGSAYVLADQAAFPELLKSALMIFPFAGAFRGALNLFRLADLAFFLHDGAAFAAFIFAGLLLFLRVIFFTSHFQSPVYISLHLYSVENVYPRATRETLPDASPP